MRCPPVLMSLTLIAAGLAGCEATHLVYVHNMDVGIAVTPITSEGTAKLTFGFDRETFALVPRKGKAEDGADAMSLTAISKVRAVGLEHFQFSHVIATGEAARTTIQSGDQLSKSVERVFGRPAGPTPDKDQTPETEAPR